MELYSNNKDYKLYHGNMLDMLEVIEPNTIDSIITDPPYELNFMNKGWDNSGIAFQPSTWTKCYEVLKPGGYLLAFGGSRTFHRIACAIEDAGFEIRDTIMWLYGSGFPKSMDISKQIDKRNGKTNNDFIEFGTYLKEKRGNKSQTKLRNIFLSKNGNPTGQMSNWEMGKSIPTIEQYKILKKELKLDNRFDWLIEREEAEREVIGKGNDYGHEKEKYIEQKFGFKSNYNITAPATDLAKQWNGWGTALKPSFEPIIVARKPFKSSLVDNVIEYGVGGINIDECRVGTEEISYFPTNLEEAHGNKFGNGAYMPKDTAKPPIIHNGKFPANTILTYDETDFDEVCGGFPDTKSQKTTGKLHDIRNGSFVGSSKQLDVEYERGYNDSGSASRYFYCAKASKKDRDEGLDNFEEKQKYYCDGRSNSLEIFDSTDGGRKPLKNIHPTVKPTELMQYLVRLVSPNGATILDPFNGSGSTGKAVMYENKERNKNYKYIGIELTEEYLPISKARIECLVDSTQEEPKEDIPTGQTNIFDFIGESND